MGTNEWLKKLEENWEKVVEKDEKSKEKGKLVGRYIAEPIADGNAVYEIVRENKNTVRIEVVTGIGDDWVIPYWGPSATIDKDYAISSVGRRDGLARIFGRK